MSLEKKMYEKIANDLILRVKKTIKNRQAFLLRYDHQSTIESIKYKHQEEIDIVVELKDHEKIISSILYEFSAEHIFIVNLMKSIYSSNVDIILKGSSNFIFIRLDIRTRIIKKDYFLYDFNSLHELDLIYIQEGFWYLKEGLEAALLILRNYLDQRDFDAKHIKILNQVNEIKSIHKCFETLSISYKFEIPYNWNEISISNIFIDTNSLSKDGLSLKKRIINKLTYTKFLSKRIIAFYGPDGVGKTTLAQKISEVTKHEWYHFYRKNNKEESLIINRITSKKKYEFIRRYIPNRGKILGFIDFYFNTHLKYYRRQTQFQRDIFIHDRYILDYFLKQAKPLVFKKIYIKLYKLFRPKKALEIILIDNPENILNRNKELSPDEINDIYTFFAWAKKVNTNVLTLDISEIKTFNEVFVEIIKLISNDVINQYYIKYNN